MKLQVHNYGIIEDLSAELKPGLTVLTGVNGSGKSTTVDALFFALTGESLDGRNLVELINWGAMDGKACVELSCDDFTVRRTIKSSGVSHRLIIGDTELSKRGDINTWLFDYFKIDNPEVIKTVFISAQLHATDLFDTTDSNRLAMLSKVFGLEHIEQCRSAIYKVLAESPVPTVDPELIAQATERRNTAAKEMSSSYAAYLKAQDELLADPFDSKEYERVRSATLDTEREVRSKALNEAYKSEEEISSELANLKTALDDFQLMWKYAEAESMEREIERDKEEIAKLQGGVDLDALNQAARTAESKREALKAEIVKLEGNVEKITVCPLTGGDPCLALLRMHDPELVRRELEAKRAELQTVSDDCLEISNLVSDRMAQMTHVGSLTALLITAQKKLAEIAPPEDYKERLVELRERLPEDVEPTRKRHQILETAHQHNLKVIEENDAWLKSHSDDLVVSQEEKQFWEDQKSQHSRLESEYDRASKEYVLRKNFLDDAKAALDALEKSKALADAFQFRADNLRDVRELMSRNQLQRALLRSTINRINREIESCASLFNFAFNFSITDSGAIVFQTDSVAGKEVKFLSGGQKYVAAIITRIAFARVLSTRFPFMILDEPSICLDDGSRELLAAFMEALNNRFSKENKYLIVPTHDELILSKGRKITMEDRCA